MKARIAAAARWNLATRGSLFLPGIVGALTTPPALAQNAGADIEEVVVTGSRIPRAGQEAATGVTVVSAADLENQGFRNVYDALNQQTQNTGFTQGADFGNTFTPAANAINLRGLGPNHTLVLINGRRVADYPTAYDGQVNFVNLANIPSAAIERIEILNGGASGIYGSDAIAGVANVILKERATGLSVNVKAGTTEHGGGDNGRLQLVGGNQTDRLSTVFALEFSKTDPIWSRQRDFMSSSTLAGATPTNVWSMMNLDTGAYINPGDACSALSANFAGTVAPATARQGTFCGSGKAQPTYWTTQTGNDSANLYSSAKFALNDDVSLFADIIAGQNRTENNTRGPTWTSVAANSGFFFNQNTGNNEVWSKRIAPEEIGGVDNFDRFWRDKAAAFTTGIEGKLGDNGWRYEAAYNGSVYESRNERPRLLAGIDSYYLGPQLGVNADGVPIYAPDAAKFSQPLTAAEFSTLVGSTRSKDLSWLQTVSLSANGKLLDLPAGPVQTAGVLEWGNQGFSNTPDPQINEGLFFNTPPVDKVSGSRKRYAAAVEFRVPVFEPLTTTLAGRFDDYTYAGNGNSKFTYNAGLEYRPVRTLLLRGNYATSFRAPDMNYIYQTLVRGYFASTTDYYRCKLANQALSDCDFANVSPGSNFIQSGNKDLRFENGKSFGYGAVWSPSTHFDVSLDYWSLRIDDLVTNIDDDTLLRIEADCRTGARDANSTQCVDAFTRVQRNPADAVLNPNAITNILVNPINAAFERTSGIDATSKVRWSLGERNQFVWSTAFTRVLTHRRRQFAGDPEENVLPALDNVDWPSKLITNLTWSYGAQWSSDLQVTRYGKIPNAAQEAFLPPESLVNLSTHYEFNKNGSVGLIVNNVFDTVKNDPSFGWPFYPVGNYLPYGRQYWLDFNYRFGT
jgi:iron complex outermembrane receptor protein